MIIRVPVDQGQVWVTSENHKAAKRQAKALSRDMGWSARLMQQMTVHPGHFALGSEALLWLKSKTPDQLNKKSKR